MPSARLLFACACLSLLAAPPVSARPARSPDAVRALDVSRRLDAGGVRFAHSNIGAVGTDLATAGAGLYFPPGTLNTVLYSAGLWLGGTVGGSNPRLAIAEYAHEFAPGAIVGGAPDFPGRPEYAVWKSRWPYANLARDTSHLERTPEELLADPALDLLAQHGWGEYLARAVPFGAPMRTWRLPNDATPDPGDSLDVPGPDVLGRLSTWCVFNDADPARHLAVPGGTAPLGVEVQQRVWSLGDAWPSLDKVVFVRWTIVNRGSAAIDSFRVGLWADPDIGTSTGDLVGWDGPTQMGYAYRGAGGDTVYGRRSPAVGMLFLTPPAPGQATASAFHRYINGTDPQNAIETWHLLNGLSRDGLPRFDPSNGQPAAYDVPGDPVNGTGWLDTAPADRRGLLVQPIGTLASGASVEVTVAFLVAQGDDRIASVAQLRCTAGWLRQMWAAGFPEPAPAPPLCVIPTDCPRRSTWWGDACGGPALPADTLASIAAAVDQASTTLAWATPAPSFCATVGGAGGTPRERALAEYAALLANAVASVRGTVPADGFPIRLGGALDASCPEVRAADLNELLRRATRLDVVPGGRYLDPPGAHVGAGLDGVPSGLTGFNGGAGAAYDFFAGIDPALHPEQFTNVRITFDRARPRKAYRYLRLEQASGAAPIPGRAYRYGGYHETFLTAVDQASGDTLALAFAERAVADEDGSLLDPAFQLATFDSTWLPDASDLGGREYLFVLRTPWTPTPSPALAVDGAVLDGAHPWLYAAWTRRTNADPAVLDDGDAFEFTFEVPDGPGVDQALFSLGQRPSADPFVDLTYARIADCLGAINRGDRSSRTCDAPTAVLASLLSAFARADRVSLEWAVGVAEPVVVERRAPGEAWLERARVLPDGAGRVAWEDADVSPGVAYDYRLRLGGVTAGDVRVTVPASHRLSLGGLRPNPASAASSVVFSLGTREAATVELFDAAGRRVWSRALRSPEPGSHVLPLGDARLAPGVYLVRLAQGRERATTKAVVVR